MPLMTIHASEKNRAVGLAKTSRSVASRRPRSTRSPVSGFTPISGGWKMKRTAAPVSAAMPPEAPSSTCTCGSVVAAKAAAPASAPTRKSSDHPHPAITLRERRREDREPHRIEQHVLPSGVEEGVGERRPQQRQPAPVDTPPDR